METVKDILAKKGDAVVAIGRDHTVQAAAQLMAARHIGALVVTEGESVIGIFTERDVLTRVVAAGRDPAATLVGDVMSTPVACCRPDTRLAECRSVITEKRVRHLPVVESGKLVGIVTSGDILAQELSVHQQTIEYMHQYLYGQHR